MSGGEVEFLRPHLNDAGVSDETVDELVRRWAETGTASFVQHLGMSGVLAPADAKQLIMVFKGYVALNVAGLLGSLDLSAVQPAESTAQPEPEPEPASRPIEAAAAPSVYLNSYVQNAAIAESSDAPDGSLSFFGGRAREAPASPTASARFALDDAALPPVESPPEPAMSGVAEPEPEPEPSPEPSAAMASVPAATAVPEPEPRAEVATDAASAPPVPEPVAPESMSLSAFVSGRDPEPAVQSHLVPNPAAPIQPPPGTHVVPEVPTPPVAAPVAVPPAPPATLPAVTPPAPTANPLAGAFSNAPAAAPEASSAPGPLTPTPMSAVEPSARGAGTLAASASVPATGSASFPLQQTPDGPVRIEVGAVFGRYKLQEMLGEGSTSRIFRAFHETLGVPVAIKVYRPTSRVNSAELESKFINEARMLARLDHPNIVRVLDVDIADHLPFIVFEYVGAMTLEELTQATGKLPADRVARVGIQVADALANAAEQSLLHRDVKPANVLLKKDGTAKLADFGLATVDGDEGEATICGSPAYMAPEQILDPVGVDHRADMYGLGATLYHAAVGQPPFVRSSPKETLRAQIHEMPTPIHELEPGFNEALSNLIMRLLEKKPDNRFLNWAEVCAALRTCMSIVTEGSTRHHPQRDASGSSTGRLKRVMSSILGTKSETS